MLSLRSPQIVSSLNPYFLNFIFVPGDLRFKIRYKKIKALSVHQRNFSSIY